MIGTIIATAVAVGGSIWAVLAKIFKLGKVMQHLDEFENRVTSELAKIQNGLDKLPCAFHHDDITKMKSILVQKYPAYLGVFSIKASPRKLNDLGTKLYADINGGELREFANEDGGIFTPAPERLSVYRHWAKCRRVVRYRFAP